MNIAELRYFLALYDKASISAAADYLHISSQGLGKALKRFESKLGVTLFVRTPLGIVPTEDAEALIDSFRGMVALDDDVRRYLSSRRSGSRQRYFLGRDSPLGDAICEGVAMYNAEHPEAAIEPKMVQESENWLAKRFVEGGYDFRFCSSEMNVLPELSCEQLCTLRFVPVCSSQGRFAKNKALCLNDLRTAQVLTTNESITWVKLLRLKCRRQGFEPNVREVPFEYIKRLLSRPGDEVFFIKDISEEVDSWDDGAFTVLSGSAPFETKIVVQSIRDDIPPDLLKCLRESVAAHGYYVGC